MNKEYLGDSVYADVNQCGQLVLTTENGFGPSNTIYIEPEVWSALMRYAVSHFPAAEKLMELHDAAVAKETLRGVRVASD